jgi:hypothetical protein
MALMLVADLCTAQQHLAALLDLELITDQGHFRFARKSG